MASTGEGHGAVIIMIHAIHAAIAATMHALEDNDKNTSVIENKIILNMFYIIIPDSLGYMCINTRPVKRCTKRTVLLQVCSRLDLA